MRDKESVTQIFILYGYEKIPRCHTHRELFFMHQAAKVLPGGGTIEIPFVCISLTAFIRALYQRNR